MSDYLDPEIKELLGDFFSEAQAQVYTMEAGILALEDNPEDSNAVDELFRAAHTLKGSSSAVQMNEIATFTHTLEDSFDAIRSGGIKISQKIIDILLESLDLLKKMVDSRINRTIHDQDFSELKNRLVDISGLSKIEEPKISSSQEKTSDSTVFEYKMETEELKPSELISLQNMAGEGEKITCISVSFDESNPMNTVGPVQIFARLKEIGQVLKTAPDFDYLYADMFHPVVHYYIATESDFSEIEKIVTIEAVTLSHKIQFLENNTEPLDGDTSSDDKSLNTEQNSKEIPVSENKKKKSGTILRVNSLRIDSLLNLVSEAVINKSSFNQIALTLNTLLRQAVAFQMATRENHSDLVQIKGGLTDDSGLGFLSDRLVQLRGKSGDVMNMANSLASDFKKTVQLFQNAASDLNRNIGELNETVLRIRMVPISQIFSRFPRLVRDLSKNLNKEVDLKIEGTETGVDKSIMEELLDPLTHCVRNSMDHGIESPSERKKKGKPENGKLTLRAFNSGSAIFIEIEDDGGGIDIEKVRSQAVEKGIISHNTKISDEDGYNLIFEPGFSTASNVTTISGRGVGLDVVRKQIEKVDGLISVWSEKGKGSRFSIRLPLTLAILHGLLVKIGSDTYAMPVKNVIESYRVKRDEMKKLNNRNVTEIRDEIIGIVDIGDFFCVENRNVQEYYFIIILENEEKKIGVIVDSLIGEEDIVIKPLKQKYNNSPLIAGATIMGDGTVALILDVPQIFKYNWGDGIKENLSADDED